MKLTPLVGLVVGGLAGLGTASVQRRNFDSNDYYVLHLERDAQPDLIASRLGLRHEGQLGQLPGHHIFSTSKAEVDIVRRAVQDRRRKRSLGGVDIIDGVKASHKQKLRAPMQKRIIPPPPAGYTPPKRADQPDAATVEKQKSVMQTLSISDPIFNEQWHLLNTVQLGHDVNVTGVWLAGVTGKNATVAIVDDGLDMYSNDLKPNYYAEGSYDFNDQRPEPRPTLSDDRHGTRCAGEVSAARNDVCGVGVAYDSKIAGIRILSKLISDADEAEAMNYDFQHNDIYSCSWGPPDDGKSMDAPGLLIKKAMLNGVQNGRGKKGSIYVFASGNGAASEDNCNFDGYTNSIYSITVGAIDRQGAHPYYSEKCSAQLVVTYSSGSGDAIHTTDVGENQCYNGHGGTSAAAPLAAGIFALALEVRPDLSWRDMQYIALESAVPVDLDTGEWQPTTIGKKYSHTFGYGKVDSWALVEIAKTWKNVKPQAWYYSPWLHVRKEIPQGDQGLSVSFEVTQDMLKEANFERLEHVTVTMNVEHTRRGDLSVDLISPNNVISHLSATRKLDTSTEGYDDWTFMSVVHWGESGVGKWTLIVRDTKVNDNTGNFTDWHLKLWGESIDASKATLLPMPSEDDDADHDVTSTTTVPAATTSLPPNPETTNTVLPTSLPSDHPERPTKPTQTTSGSVATPTSTETAAETTAPSSWLPSFLPTFGVSSSTQAWIYGALGLIVAFCAGLGAWFWFVRRKQRLNNPRDDYEFEPLNADDGGEGLGATGEKGQKRRAGELYDAFAGGSEDEAESSETDHFSIASHDEDDDDDDHERRPGHVEKQSSRLLGDSR
ncbi:peptidase S8/S53 domain-containing protein [Annulohypoxylon maeteangense]|uniref:peptidase S8/S53 domain-containing protein n=1 Tax=Annulohypoxylon maeteangense TaxID=1927788 RepID=UPI002007E528|nr:peptidase S8/S53 domain-containing protein [Annulohypoxylon maeteangense]KAI0882156.1 peptidase S8/S53 domain-containing protein [Annulohypoxylon maeteangense]